MMPDDVTLHIHQSPAHLKQTEKLTVATSFSLSLLPPLPRPKQHKLRQERLFGVIVVEGIIATCLMTVLSVVYLPVEPVIPPTAATALSILISTLSCCALLCHGIIHLLDPGVIRYIYAFICG